MSTTPSRFLFSSFLLGVSSLAAASCVSSDDGSLDPACTENCELPPVIASSAIVDCWVTPGGSPGSDSRRDVLECTYDAPANYPVRLLGASVFGRDASGADFSMQLGRSQNGDVVTVATLAPSSYPVELGIDIRFDPKDRGVTALQGLEQVRSRKTLESPKQYSISHPATAFIPFDLWELNLVGRDLNASGLSFNYSIEVGGGNNFDVDYKSTPLVFGHTEKFYLPVDVGTFALDANLVFSGGGGGTNVLVTGAGDYVVRDGHFSRAESTDLPSVLSEGSEVASCWFTLSDAGKEQLFCQANENRGFDLNDSTIVVETTNGKVERVKVSGEPTFIATVSPHAFPMRINIQGAVQSGIVGLESMAGATMRVNTVVVSYPNDLPRQNQPRSLRAPFEVWKATIDNQSEAFEGRLNDYVLELGYALSGRFASQVQTAELPAIGQGQQSQVFVATPVGKYEMPASGSVLVGGEAVEINFTLHPGITVVGQ